MNEHGQKVHNVAQAVLQGQGCTADALMRPQLGGDIPGCIFSLSSEREARFLFLVVLLVLGPTCWLGAARALLLLTLAVIADCAICSLLGLPAWCAVLAVLGC